MKVCLFCGEPGGTREHIITGMDIATLAGLGFSHM